MGSYIQCRLLMTGVRVMDEQRLPDVSVIRSDVHTRGFPADESAAQREACDAGIVMRAERNDVMVE